MSICRLSLFRIVCEALRPGAYGRRMGLEAILVAAIIFTLAADIGWGALLGLLVGGGVLWHGQRHRKRSVEAANKDAASDRLKAVDKLKARRLHDNPTRHAQMIQIIDQVQARHPQWKEAQLIKAGILLDLCGDRYGARSHCHDLLCKVRQDDPLFEEICSLYLRTCRTPHSRPVKPAVPLPVGTLKTLQPMPVEAPRAKIIPFKSSDARPASAR